MRGLRGDLKAPCVVGFVQLKDGTCGGFRILPSQQADLTAVRPAGLGTLVQRIEPVDPALIGAEFVHDVRPRADRPGVGIVASRRGRSEAADELSGLVHRAAVRHKRHVRIGCRPLVLNGDGRCVDRFDAGHVLEG